MIQVESNLKQNKIITAVNAEDGSNIEIELRQFISLGECSTFVEKVIEMLKFEGSVLEEHSQFIKQRTFLEFYTNIELPQDINECSLFIAENQPLILKLMNEVNIDQLRSIFESIEIRKENIRQKAIKANDDLDMLAIHFGNLIRNLNEMLENQKATFDGIDLATLVSNLAKKKLSEEKVIETIIGKDKSKKNKDNVVPFKKEDE